jgi:uncharacterized protein (TIGR02246 family)
MNDEEAIHELVAEWQRATAAGDLDTVLSLMADDALFLVPGREPFGKEAFSKSSRERGDVDVEGKSDIQELHVAGEWAWMRTHIDVTMTPPGGSSSHRSGYALTVLHKESDGRWVLARDANLLPPPS